MNERGTNPLRRLYGGIPLNQIFKEELLILQLSACYGRMIHAAILIKKL